MRRGERGFPLIAGMMRTEKRTMATVEFELELSKFEQWRHLITIPPDLVPRVSGKCRVTVEYEDPCDWGVEEILSHFYEKWFLPAQGGMTTGGLKGLFREAVLYAVEAEREAIVRMLHREGPRGSPRCATENELEPICALIRGRTQAADYKRLGG